MTDPIQEREISPFIDEVENIRCPSCNKPASFHELNQEGGMQCEGCGRRIVLKIESHDEFGEWRNVPEDSKHKYR